MRRPPSLNRDRYLPTIVAVTCSLEEQDYILSPPLPLLSTISIQPKYSTTYVHSFFIQAWDQLRPVTGLRSNLYLSTYGLFLFGRRYVMEGTLYGVFSLHLKTSKLSNMFSLINVLGVADAHITREPTVDKLTVDLLPCSARL